MNIHRLRVVDYDTPVRNLEGTSTIIERDEESSNDQKDESGAKIDDKNTASEENGGGDQNATSDSATCPASSKRLCLLKRRSKSELFRLPSHPKLKKLATKNTSSSEDLKKSSKNKERSNHRSRYNLVFNRDSILNLNSKGGDVKPKKNNANKNEERLTMSDSEKTNLTARVLNRRKEKNDTPKQSNDAFGFQKTNQQFDPCLYQMSCHFLDIDNHSTLNMLKKRFRYKQLRKKQKRQQEMQRRQHEQPSNDVQNKHQQLRVLNSQLFHGPEKELDKYYSLAGYGNPHKIAYEKPHKTKPSLKIYKDTWRRNYTNLNLRKDANVFVSSSVLIPKRKYCIERACGCSPINIVCENQSTSQSKTPVVKSESVTSERQKLVTEIVNSITSCKAIHPIKRVVKISMKNICLGLLIIVWSPCLLAVILALIIMSPWRLTKLLGGNTACETAYPNNSFFDKCKPKCLVHECQRICSNYTKSQQKSVLSSVAGWFTRIAGTAAASCQATLSLVKLNKNRLPTCAGSSFVPKATCKHPNPKTRYNLYYANDRGWVIKPVHYRKQYHDMRCEYSPKIRHSSRLCARLKKRRSSEVCCTSKDMILEVKPSKPKVDECACSEAITKNRGDGCCCTTPISNPPQTKKKQVNMTPGQSSPTVDTKSKSNVLCSCMHNQITTNMNSVRLNNTAYVPVSHFVRPHICVGMLYGVTTNYPCGVLSHSMAQNKAPHIGKANNEQSEIPPNNIMKHQSTSIDNILNTPKTNTGRTQLLSNLQSNTTQTMHIPKLDILHPSQGQTICYPIRQACGISSQVRLVDTNFPIKTNTYQQTSIPRTPYTSKIDLFHVVQSQASKYFSNKQESSVPPYTIGGLVDKAISYTPSIITVEHVVKKNETNSRNKSVRYNTVVDKYHPNLQSNKSQLFKRENKWICAAEESTDQHENVKECLSKSTETTQKKSLPFAKPSKFSQTKKSAFMIQSQGTMFPSEAVLQTSKCNYCKKTNKFMSFINGKRDPNNLAIIAKWSGCACEYHNSNKFPLCKRKDDRNKSSIHKVIPFIKGLALSCKQKLKNSRQQKQSEPCPCEKNKTERCPPLSKISERSLPTNKSPSLENIKCPCDIVADTRLKKCFSVDENHSIKSRASQLLKKSTELARKNIKTSTAPEKNSEAKSTITSPSPENAFKRDMLMKETGTSTSLEKESRRTVKKIPPLLDKATLHFNQVKKTTISSTEKVTEYRTQSTNTRLSLEKAVKRVTKTIKTSTSSLQKVITSQSKVTKKTSTQTLQKVIEPQSYVTKKISSPSPQIHTEPQSKFTKIISSPSQQKLTEPQSKLTKKTSSPSLQKLTEPQSKLTKKTSSPSLQKLTEPQSKLTKKTSPPSLQKLTEPQSKFTKRISSPSQQKLTEPQSKFTKKTSSPSLQKLTEPQSKFTKKISSPSQQKLTEPQSKLTKKTSSPSLQKLTAPQSKVTKKATTSTSPRSVTETQSMVTNTSPPAIEKLSKYATGTSALEKPPGLCLIDQSRKSCFTNNKAKVTSFENVECACNKAVLKSGENKFDGPCPCELIRKPGTTRLPLSDPNLTDEGSEYDLTKKVLLNKACPCALIRQYPQSNKMQHNKKTITCECKVRETQTDIVKKMSDKACPCSQINEYPKLTDIAHKSCAEEEAQAILTKKDNQYPKSQLNKTHECLCEVKETQTVISKNMSDKACPCEIIHQKGGKTADTSSSQEKKIECGCKERKIQTDSTNKMSGKACPCVNIRQSPFKKIFKTIESRIDIKMSDKIKKKKVITCECKVKETQTDLVKKVSDKACPCSLINEYPKLTDITCKSCAEEEAQTILTKKINQYPKSQLNKTHECLCEVKETQTVISKNMSDKACPCEVIHQKGGKTAVTPLSQEKKIECGCKEKKIQTDSANKMSGKACPCVNIRQSPFKKKYKAVESRIDKIKKKKAITCECKVKETQTDLVKKISDKACPCSLINEYPKLESQIILSKKTSDKACPCEIVNQYSKLCKTEGTSSRQVDTKESAIVKASQTETRLSLEKATVDDSKTKKIVPQVKPLHDINKPGSTQKDFAIKKNQSTKTSQVSSKQYGRTNPQKLKSQSRQKLLTSYRRSKQLHRNRSTSNSSMNVKQTRIPKKSLSNLPYGSTRQLSQNQVTSTSATQTKFKKYSSQEPYGSTKQLSQNQVPLTSVTQTKSPKNYSSQEPYGSTKQLSQNQVPSTSVTQTKPKKYSSQEPYGSTKQLSQNQVTSTSVTQTKSPKKYSSHEPNNKPILSPQDQSTPKASKMLLLNVSPPGSLSYKHSVILKSPTRTKISTQRSNISINRLKKISKHYMDLRDSINRRTKVSSKPQQRLASQKLLFSHDHTTQSEIDPRFAPRNISHRAKTNQPQKNISRVSLFSNSESQNQKCMSRKLSRGSVCSLHASSNLHQQSYRPTNLKPRFPQYSVRAVPSRTRIKSKMYSRDVSTASSSSQFRSLKAQIFSKTKLEHKKSPFYLPQFNRWRSVSKSTEHKNKLLGDPSCSTIFIQSSSEESAQSQQLPLLNNMPNQPVIATCISPDKSAWISSQKSEVEKQLGISNLPWSQLNKQSVHSKSTQIHRITPIPWKTKKRVDLAEKQRVTRISSKCNQTSKHLFFVTDNISNNSYSTKRKLQPESQLTRKTILKDSSQQTFARNLLVNQQARSVSEQGTGMSGLRICVHSKQSLPKHSYRQTGFENKSLENKVQNIPNQQSRLTQQIEPIPTVQMAPNTLQFAPYYISPYSNMLATQNYGGGGLEVPQQLISAPLLFGCPLSKQNNSSFGCPVLKQNNPSFGCPLSTQTDHAYASPLSKQTNYSYGYAPLIPNDPCFGTIFKMQQSTQTCELTNKISPNIKCACQIHRKPKVVECKCNDSKYLPKKQSVDSICRTKKEKVKCGCFEKSKLSRKIICECYDKNIVQVQADRQISSITDAYAKDKCTCYTQKPTSERIKCECFDENNKLKQQSRKDASPKITCDCVLPKQSSEKIECECKKMAKGQSIAIPEKKSEIKLPNLPGSGAPLVYQKPVQAKIEKSLAKEPTAHHGEKKIKATFNQTDLERSIERQRRKMIMKQMKVKAAMKKIKKKKHSEPSCWEQIKDTVKETEEQAWPLERSHFQAKILKQSLDENLCCMKPVKIKEPVCPASKQVTCFAKSAPADEETQRTKVSDDDMPLRYRKPKRRKKKEKKPQQKITEGELPAEKSAELTKSKGTEIPEEISSEPKKNKGLLSKVKLPTSKLKGNKKQTLESESEYTVTSEESEKQKAKTLKAQAAELKKARNKAKKEKSKMDKKLMMEQIKLQEKAEKKKLKDELKLKEWTTSQKLKEAKKHMKVKQKEYEKKLKLESKKRKAEFKSKTAKEKKKLKISAKLQKKHDKLKEKMELKAEKQKFKDKLKKEKNAEKLKRKEEARAEKKKRKEQKAREKLARGPGYLERCIQGINQIDKDVFPIRVTCRPMYIHTLRKRPCLWIYGACPWFYPCFLQCFQCLRDSGRMLCYILSLMVWAPIVYCCNCCFEMLVCAC